MKPIGLLVMLMLLMLPYSARAQSLVSAFAGSETLGEYKADFEPFQIAQQKGEEVEVIEVEGRMQSHIYRKPEDKANMELFRSYQKELTKAGFDILLAYSKRKGNVQNLIRKIYGPKANDLYNRHYVSNGKPAANSSKDRIKTFAEFYIAASKAHGDKTAYVAVVICRERGLYAVDVLITEAMAQGTVTLSMELLEEKIENDGKIAIYDIHFATGSAEIQPDSRPALKIIAEYIRSNPNRNFYLVGHTDDTGGLKANLALSENRAAAVVEALGRQFKISAGRLTAAGAGPYAPVASNGTAAGQRLNRRVELVLRLHP